MSNELTRNQRLFVEAIAKAAAQKSGVVQTGAAKTNYRGGCPSWLAQQYKDFTPSYIFDDGVCAAYLKEIRREAGRYVGVYAISVHNLVNPRHKWVEEYTYVFQNHVMVEKTQKGVPSGWRRRK